MNFSPSYSKLGKIWEHFPSYSLYKGIIGTCKSQYRRIIGKCKSQDRGVIETRKIHQLGLLLGHANRTEGKFLRPGKPFIDFIGEIM